MKKFLLLLGLGVGFVLGSRAGREPYERLRTTVNDLTERREFKRLADSTTDLANSVAQDVSDKVSEATDRASDKVDKVSDKVSQITGRNDGGSATTHKKAAGA